MHYTPWIAFLAADRAHCQNLQLQIKLLFFVVVAVLARCQAIAITPTVSTSISRPNTPDNQRFPPPCGQTRRRVGVVTASKSILPRLSQFNEGEPHSATFWNSARLLPWRSRYQALKCVYCDKLMGIQRDSITNYTQKVIGAYIWILSQWLRVTLAVD